MEQELSRVLTEAGRVRSLLSLALLASLLASGANAGQTAASEDPVQDYIIDPTDETDTLADHLEEISDADFDVELTEPDFVPIAAPGFDDFGQGKGSIAEGSQGATDSGKPPVAANIDLSEPVVQRPDSSTIDIGMIAPPMEPKLFAEKQKSLMMLGAEVAAGTSTRLEWSPEHSFAGIAAPTPVLVVNGATRGPTLCVTAAIHGDELNGIETVRRVLYDLEPSELAGAVIGVPIVNLEGFRRASRYLPDRRDLNRYFPGNPRGSSASRLAHSFFTEVISHCDALVDLHTGSFQRTNLPQLRADLQDAEILDITQGFGSTVVLHSVGAKGTLRRAATDAGIPTVTLEAGEPARVQDAAVSHSTKGVMTLLNQMGMYEKVPLWGNREPVYYRSRWIRANQGGVLFSKVELGEHVDRGQILGTVTDPITNVQSELRATSKGRVLGMALDQFVMPGFAAFRIGMQAAESGTSVAPAIDISVGNAADSDHGDFIEAEEYDDLGDAESLEVRDNLEDSE